MAQEPRGRGAVHSSKGLQTYVHVCVCVCVLWLEDRERCEASLTFKRARARTRTHPHTHTHTHTHTRVALLYMWQAFHGTDGLDWGFNAVRHVDGEVSWNVSAAA